MEQYFMPLELDYVHLRKCLDHYQAEHIFIREMGSRGGKHLVNEDLTDRTLDFRISLDDELTFLIDGQSVGTFFHGNGRRLPNNFTAGFSIFYERFYNNGRMVMLPTGVHPDDLQLPSPRRTILRGDLDFKLLEITFLGKIPLKKHFEVQPGYYLWTIDC